MFFFINESYDRSSQNQKTITKIVNYENSIKIHFFPSYKVELSIVIMANDREVLKFVFEGKVPCCFELSEDLQNISEPEKFYLLISRVSYLPLVTDKVRKHFQKYISNQDAENEMWFSFNKKGSQIPLKWHYPIGLLFDLLVTDETLPWSLSVHFTKFPEDALFKCPNK